MPTCFRHPSVPGEVLIDESPFVTSLYPQFHSTRCMGCFRRLGDRDRAQECKGCSKVSREEGKKRKKLVSNESVTW